MRVVIAVGGNALLQRGDRPDAQIQLTHIRDAARALASTVTSNEVVICHGNGPQVGLLATESESDPALSQPYPLDDLVAQTQGMIGYWLAQALHNAGVNRPVLSVVSQTVVSPESVHALPTKFIGPVYSHAVAHQLATAHRWTIAADGEGYRRVVVSPAPVRVVEEQAISALLGLDMVVVCAGGGGVPVREDPDGILSGVEAVVDKDSTAAELAIALKADRLLILTDVEAVQRDFGSDHATAMDVASIDELEEMSFPDGSMGPKIAACVRFVRATGNSAAIGSLTRAGRVLAGTSGTTITPTRMPANAPNGG
jgi:carbamate kinase